MKHIPTLFKREHIARHYQAVPEWNEDCLWVRDGEGVPTHKYDGTACLYLHGTLYARHKHDAKKGDPPPGWTHWSGDESQTSGHGWRPISKHNPADRWHVEALEAHRSESYDLEEGTWELCGPKIGGNPEGLLEHAFLYHGEPCMKNPRTFTDIRDWLEREHFEGIVWHHPDGRMAKIKRRDFGIPWPELRERVMTEGDDE